MRRSTRRASSTSDRPTPRVPSWSGRRAPATTSSVSGSSRSCREARPSWRPRRRGSWNSGSARRWKRSRAITTCSSIRSWRESPRNGSAGPRKGSRWRAPGSPPARRCRPTPCNSMLELTRARVEVLRQRNALGTARYELGRLVGEPGPVDAVPFDTTAAPPLPISMPEAVRIGLDQGPQYRAAQASERAAEANLKAQKSDYLPTLSIGGLHQRYRHRAIPRCVEHQLGHVRVVLSAVEQRSARDRGKPRPRES